MSRWKSAYDSQQTAQSALSALMALESIKVEAMSEADLAEYYRLLKVLKVLTTRLTKLDPELLALNSWSQIPAYLSQARAEIVAFGPNRNITHLHNANGLVDKVISLLKPFDSGTIVEEFKSIADANAVFQQKIIDELERVRARGDEIRAQHNALSEAIAQGKARLEENNQIIQQQKARLDQSIAEFQKQFSDAQEKRTNDFADTLKRKSDEFSAQGKQFESRFSEDGARRKQEYESFFGDARKQSDQHLDFLCKREEEVKRIFNVIGNVAVAGNFKETADREGASANWLRVVALFLMLGMAGSAAATFIHSLSHSEVDWRLFGFRLSTTLILAVPAFYAAQESAKHREREKLNRKLHLELSAIDAYLELLPDEKRHDLKAKLTERFFGQPEIKEKDETVTKHELFELLSKMLQNFTKGK